MRKIILLKIMLRKFGNIPNDINNKKPKKIIRYNKIIIIKFYLNIILY